MFTFVWIRAGTKVHHFLDELRSLPSCQHDSRFEPLIRWEQVICSKYILSVSTIKYLLTEWKNATVFIQFILCSNQDGNEDNVRRGVNDCKILNPPISGRWLYCPSVTTEIPETVSDWTIMEQQLLRDYDFCLLLWSNISFTISLLSFISKQRVVNRNPGDSKYCAVNLLLVVRRLICMAFWPINPSCLGLDNWPYCLMAWNPHLSSS